SIVVASRDSNHLPTLVRGIGCKVAADLKCVTVFVWKPQAGKLLECVRATGTLACVFCEVTSHRTIQVKSVDARITKTTAHDRGRIEKYRDTFDHALGELGDGGTLARGLVVGDPAECVGIAFT